MKKRIKKILALAMTGSMAMSVAGCGQDEGDTNTSGEVVTLHILENDTAKEEGYFQELLDAFNEAYKDKGIQAVDANMDEYTDLAQNGPYGYGPDVLYQANDKLMTYAEDKHILALDIEAFDCYETTPDEAWDAFRIVIDGEEYCCGVPVNIQEPMLFYREDMMPENWEEDWDDDKNGVADFFENWNDLYAYSKLLRDTDTSANKNSQYGYMASLNNLYMTSEFIFSYGGYIFGKDSSGAYDSTDIGFNAGNAGMGLMAVKQFAALMNEGCIDDTITMNRYEKLANGTYFCTISTPDTLSLFIEKLKLKYEDDGLGEDEALQKATENIKMIELPAKMPANGDLSEDSSLLGDDDWTDTIVMGGVNGYGISSYTEHREESIEFVNFATSYEMIKTRADMLGIAPTRSDVAAACGETADIIFNSLKKGRIYLMPSIKAVDQIWVPAQTVLGDVAKDAFRKNNGEQEKYAALEDMKEALEGINQNIYDAIYTLAD